MDRFEAMSLLLAVVDHGSFSAASRATRMPVATLSRKVSDLESLLGARLLNRTTRKLSLTDAGLAYAANARRILEHLEETEREAAGEFMMPKGELVLSAPIFFGQLHVMPIVADFLACFPDIRIRLLLSDHNVDLVGERIDMAVRIGALPDSDMVATRIGSMRTVVCATPALVEAHGAPRDPGDLMDLPTVVMEGPQPLLGWRFGPYYQVIEAVRSGSLVVLLEEYEPDPAPVHLLHAALGQMPLKMRRFLDFSAPKLREALAHLDTPRSVTHSPGIYPR